MGSSTHPLYPTWKNMQRRCYSSADASYPRYGGRGITVCDRWLESFNNFVEDVGEKPTSAYSLDRIDNDCGYSPLNCRWATAKQQQRNTRRTRFYTWQGMTKPFVEWIELAGLRVQNYPTTPHARKLFENRLAFSLKKTMP